jgi:hypothetical protein
MEKLDLNELACRLQQPAQVSFWIKHLFCYFDKKDPEAWVDFRELDSNLVKWVEDNAEEEFDPCDVSFVGSAIYIAISLNYLKVKIVNEKVYLIQNFKSIIL